MSCQILQSTGSGRYRGSQIGSHSLICCLSYIVQGCLRRRINSQTNAVHSLSFHFNVHSLS